MHHSNCTAVLLQLHSDLFSDLLQSVVQILRNIFANISTLSSRLCIIMFHSVWWLRVILPFSVTATAAFVCFRFVNKCILFVTLRCLALVRVIVRYVKNTHLTNMYLVTQTTSASYGVKMSSNANVFCVFSSYVFTALMAQSLLFWPTTPQQTQNRKWNMANLWY